MGLEDSSDLYERSQETYVQFIEVKYKLTADEDFTKSRAMDGQKKPVDRRKSSSLTR